MTYPNTYLSLHAIEEVRASPGIALGAPVVLTIVAAHGTVQLTLFFRDGDEDYRDRLITAINGVERRPCVPDAAPAAAHDAADRLHGAVLCTT
jgi:hypothetical protein